jgi:catechol 2,3-dioxygenase-like lactoylglutathione lyase family enzyme
MLRIGSIVVRVADIDRQSRFWTEALGYVADEPSEDFVILRPRSGGGPNVSLDASRSSLTIPPRIHLDLYAEDQSAEVDRLVTLGAHRIDWSGRPADADYVILADPEGNRFCVVDASGSQSD